MRHTATVILVSLAAAAVLFARCKSLENPSGATSGSQDSILFASIERTPCFGICPVYKITIYQSGYTVLHGIEHVPNKGWFSTRLTAEQLNSISRYVYEHGIYDLHDEYIEPHIADFPTTITELNINNRYKRIVNTKPEAPEKLLKWEKFLDSFFDENTKWKRIQAPAADY